MHGNTARTRLPAGVLPARPLDADAVRTAYRRWADYYDVGFGLVSSRARRRAVDEVNLVPGGRVLEVGVGTGLALPRYDPSTSVTGIDLSGEMLAKARARVARLGLPNVEALTEMDAEDMSFGRGEFDTAVAMFVASVVPHPRRLLAEMRRVVKPGGRILFINHFSRTGGIVGGVEAALARSSEALGWHPDFRMGALLLPEEQGRATAEPQWPLGLFTLVGMRN